MIWGFGFIATRWTLIDYDPLWSNSLRYILAALLALPWLIYKKSFSGDWRRHRGAAFAGSVLFLSMYFQVWGLKYTTVAKSGFLTTFYVFFTPLLGMLFFKERYKSTLWALIALALCGVALLGDLKWSGLNRGDLITLGCALLGAMHIVVIGKLAPSIRDPIEFNFTQCFFMGVVGLVLGLVFKGPADLTPLMSLDALWGPTALAGLVFLAVFSSLLAFTMQVLAQQALPPHIVSMVFLLESLFAATFAWWTLGERLSVMNLLGAALVLASVMAIPLFELREKRRRAAFV